MLMMISVMLAAVPVITFISVLSSKCNTSSGSSKSLLPLNISILHFQLLINVIPLLDSANVRSFSVSFQIIVKLGQLWGCPKVKTVFRIFCQVRRFL